MIMRRHRQEAFAASVGVSLRGVRRDNARYMFQSEADGLEEVTFRDGAAGPGPYQGLGVTEAVLRHLDKHGIGSYAVVEVF